MSVAGQNPTDRECLEEAEGWLKAMEAQDESADWGAIDANEVDLDETGA